ncbi:DUF917 domain-containing protein [uncultured Desulfovibrio sp.]|uniref:DUF917 domain-containing protein n=1 Tax=uncultured Desulfovibrio sp. TaxID=167968 RepID=UPI002672483A|nr:DUF917 domain-containing protein [uncultured Desulfovibrio sp.]
MATFANGETRLKMTQEALRQTAMGACFLGSGGGGTLQSALGLIENFRSGEYYSDDTVEVVKVEDATEGDAVVVAYIGAPAKINHAAYPDGPVQAAVQVSSRLRELGRRLAYIVPAETGALGFTVACLVAAKLGLKVVDADGAGRAVPSLPQLTFSITEGLSPNPAIVVNQDKNLCVTVNASILPDVADCVQHKPGQQFPAARIEDLSRIIDNLMRPIISEPAFDQFGGLALWIMTPEQMRKALRIRNTLWKAWALGAGLPGFASSDDLLEYLKEKLRITAHRLFGPAQLTNAEINTEGGFDVGKVDFTDNDRICTVQYQNESLIAGLKKYDDPLCTAPDSIAYFLEPSETGSNEPKVFSNGDLLSEDGSLREDLKGRMFSVIGIAVDDVLWEQDAGIFTTFRDLLRKMGYHGEPVSIIPR